MSQDEELVRLFEDPSTSAELRADLEAVRSFEVPFDLSAGLARFQAHLDAPPSGVTHAPPAGGATAGGATTGGAAAAGAGAGGAAALQLTRGKVRAVLALGAGLGWGALHVTGGPDAPRESTRPPAVVAAPPEPASGNRAVEGAGVVPEAPAPQAPERIAPVPSSEAPAAPVRSAGAPHAASRVASSPRVSSAPAVSLAPAAPELPAVASVEAPVDPQARLREEVAQLAETRAALRTNPAAALALADRGHEQFRGGALYQEREALALQALSRLGRADALAARGAAFLARFPQSSFAPEVRHMLAK